MSVIAIKLQKAAGADLNLRDIKLVTGATELQPGNDGPDTAIVDSPFTAAMLATRFQTMVGAKAEVVHGAEGHPIVVVDCTPQAA